MDATIAYLDLLGFGTIASEDLPGAIELLDDYQSILNNKITDARTHPDLMVTEEKMCADSFDSFFPFSDSIFITSTQPDKFVKQVSHLLLDAFLLNCRFYTNPDDPANPLRTTIPQFDPSLPADKQPRIEVDKHPVLFKGGISFGEVLPITVHSIVNNEIQGQINLTGKALVEAVRLEENKQYKGPRAFATESFVQQLSAPITQKYIRLVENNTFELLWPGIIYSDHNDCAMEIREFDELFLSAVNLWRFFRNQDCGAHYDEFLKLIVRATLQYFTMRDYRAETEVYLTEKFKAYELDIKIGDV